jgi:hypothetical protein
LVRGLEPTDFEGKLGGKAVKILSVKPDERPHRIAVLLDTSGEVLGQPDAEEWVAANTIASHISQAPPQNASNRQQTGRSRTKIGSSFTRKNSRPLPRSLTEG